MKVFLIITTFLFYLCPILGKDTRGILSLADESEKIRVGQFYRYRLILFPFKKNELKSLDIFKKPFLDLFSVSQLSDIYVSSENADALIVELDMALSKHVKLKEVYILPLDEMNIPVEVRLPEVENTELLQKDFRILENDYRLADESPIMTWLFITICVGLLFIVYFFWRRKNKNKNKDYSNPVKDILLVMERAEDHAALEEIYLKRKILINLAKEKNKMSQLQSFLDAFSKHQYRPDWKSMDIKDLTIEARELAKELSHGI